MAVFPGSEQPRGPEDVAPVPEALETFARVEGLVGEERALLAIPHGERTAQQHERLRAIGEELDRIFEALRRRAQRLGREPQR